MSDLCDEYGLNPTIDVLSIAEGIFRARRLGLPDSAEFGREATGKADCFYGGEIEPEE